MLKFRGKYWATVYREVEFEATDERDADEMMDGFPCNERDIRFKEINGIEERSDYEVEQVDDTADDGNLDEPEMILPVETALVAEAPETITTSDGTRFKVTRGEVMSDGTPIVREDDGTRKCGCCGETTGDWVEVSMPFCDHLCDVCADA